MKQFRLPLSVTSYLLTMSAWLSDRLIHYRWIFSNDDMPSFWEMEVLKSE